MKATFKLAAGIKFFTTDELVVIADEIHDQHIDCYYVNGNQSITREGDSVVVSGERCALWGDDFAPIMLELKKLQQVGSAVIVSYQTSDVRLNWYETLHYYMRSDRSTPSEKMAYYRMKNYEYSACSLIELGVYEYYTQILECNSNPMRSSAQYEKTYLKELRKEYSLLKKYGLLQE
jgi:hypothetical protein